MNIKETLGKLDKSDVLLAVGITLLAAGAASKVYDYTVAKKDDAKEDSAHDAIMGGIENALPVISAE